MEIKNSLDLTKLNPLRIFDLKVPTENRTSFWFNMVEDFPNFPNFLFSMKTSHTHSLCKQPYKCKRSDCQIWGNRLINNGDGKISCMRQK